MPKEDHYRKLEQMYASAPCNEYFTLEMKIAKGEAELTMAVQKKFFHSAGAVHGSVYFKALDDVAFFACNSLVKHFFVLTVSFNIYFIRPISTGSMRALGRVVSTSRELMIAESWLFDGRGKEIGRGSGSFVKSKIRLNQEVGYGGDRYERSNQQLP